MDELDPALRKLAAQPRRKIDVIVRVRAGAGDRSNDLETLGCTVRRRFLLTRSYAVTCTGARAIRLSTLDWVERVEPDATVKALNNPERSTRR